MGEERFKNQGLEHEAQFGLEVGLHKEKKCVLVVAAQRPLLTGQ